MRKRLVLISTWLRTRLCSAPCCGLSLRRLNSTSLLPTQFPSRTGGAAREWWFLASSNRRLIFSGRMAGNIDRSSEFPPCCQNIGLFPSSTFLCRCVNIFAESKLCHTRNSIFRFLLSQGCIGTARNNSMKTIWKTNLIHFFKKRETNIFI